MQRDAGSHHVSGGDQRLAVDVQGALIGEAGADLFPSGRGRPSVPAPVVASVLVLQALHGLSDREAAEAVHVRSVVEGGVRAAGDRAGFPGSSDLSVVWATRR